MSDSAFQEFAQAASKRVAPTPPAEKQFNKVTVLGGGADAQLLAALCLAEGAEVTLFSAYGAQLDVLRKAGGISLRGDGPVGNYQIDQGGVPSIKTTAELDRAVAGCDLIFLTGPVHKQRTYAMVLADHLHDGQCVVMLPGRTLAAAEAAWLLRVGGCTADITLLEVQGMPYWTRASGTVLTLSAVTEVAAATLPSGRDEAIAGVKRFLPNLSPMSNTLQSGFADGSGLIEVPTLIVGGNAIGNGAPVIPEGGQALPENQTFRALIGAEHLALIAQMTAERHAVAARFGVRDLPSMEDWLDTCAGKLRGSGSRQVPTYTQAHHIIRCATVGSLVPLVSAAEIAEIEVPVTSAMVTLAGNVLGADVSSAGRRLERIGVSTNDIDQARRTLDNLHSGKR